MYTLTAPRGLRPMEERDGSEPGRRLLVKEDQIVG